MEQYRVSVIVPVYNHALYLQQCLDSILMQRTSFAFEVLIGEDCSTDNSRAILQKIAPTLPDNFRLFYREKNLGMGVDGNAGQLIRDSVGEYLISLEADDYWTDADKLQKQVDFLDTHPDFVAAAHPCVTVGTDSQPNGHIYPGCKDAEYTYAHFLQCLLPGQTASLMYRRLIWNEILAFEAYRTYRFFPGDQKKAFLLLMNGRVAVLPETMSAYRFIEKDSSSYSATAALRSETKQTRLTFYRNLMAFAEAKDNREALLAAGREYYYTYLENVGTEVSCTWKEYFSQLIKDRYPLQWFAYSAGLRLRVRMSQLFGKSFVYRLLRRIKA